MTGEVLFLCAQVGMVCYPVQHHPARSIVDDAVKYLAKAPASNFSWTRHILITIGFFSFNLAIALFITDLGKVERLLHALIWTFSWPSNTIGSSHDLMTASIFSDFLRLLCSSGPICDIAI